MLRNIFGLIVAALPLLLAGMARATPLEDLNAAFRSSYRLAQVHTLNNLRATVPVLVNRFSQIALYRPGVAQPELFDADEELMRETRAVAHTAASLYLRLAPYGFGALDAERMEWLVTFQGLIRGAEAEVAARTDLPGDLKSVQLGMLAEVRRVAERIHQRGEVDEATLTTLGATVRAATDRGFMSRSAPRSTSSAGRSDAGGSNTRRWTGTMPSPS
jgi:hypothetical protein